MPSAAVSVTPDDLGCRVTVRRRVDASVGDLVGTLVALHGDGFTVRRRDGTDVAVSWSDALAGRRVPDDGMRLRAARDVDPATLERIAAAGWQPAERERLGAWTLRAAGGFTGRANSTLTLGEPDRPLPDALAHVQQWYRARGLPARLQVPLPWASRLNDALATAGWTVDDDEVDVLVTDVHTVLAALGPAKADVDVTVAAMPDDEWLQGYRYRGGQLPAGARELLVRTDEPMFATLRDGGRAVAVGRAARTGRWLGITAVDVAPDRRRQGFGRAVLATLLREGQARAARYVYLQVARTNTPALALYRACGFTTHHHYHYRSLTPTPR